MLFVKSVLDLYTVTTPECTFYEIDRRSYALKKDIEKQQCLICDSKLERRLCTVTVNFKLGDRKCKMVHNGKHRHSTYLPKHLIVTEKCCLDEKVDKDPHVNPSKAVVGVSSRAGRVAPPIYNSVIRTLINKDRAKYELNNAKQRTGVSSRTSLLGEFEKIENEYAD